MPAVPCRCCHRAAEWWDTTAFTIQHSSTCSDRYERAREVRFQREARERGYELPPVGWHCAECGCTAEEAVARRARRLSTDWRVVCSPKCALARKYRRNAAVLRELQLTPKDKARRSAWEKERRKTPLTVSERAS